METVSTLYKVSIFISINIQIDEELFTNQIDYILFIVTVILCLSNTQFCDRVTPITTNT